VGIGGTSTGELRGTHPAITPKKKKKVYALKQTGNQGDGQGPTVGGQAGSAAKNIAKKRQGMERGSATETNTRVLKATEA